MNIQPILDNVLIKPLKEKRKTSGGIYLPDTSKKAPDRGSVMGVGPDVNPRIKIGKKVIFKKWEVIDVPVEGETWFIVEQKQVLAIL